MFINSDLIILYEELEMKPIHPADVSFIVKKVLLMLS